MKIKKLDEMSQNKITISVDFEFTKQEIKEIINDLIEHCEEIKMIQNSDELFFLKECPDEFIKHLIKTIFYWNNSNNYDAIFELINNCENDILKSILDEYENIFKKKYPDTWEAKKYNM